MSKGIAHGSADGPRMIYGRENVNWGGPQRANDHTDIDVRSDRYTFLEDFDADLEDRIESLLENHPDDKMLHRYHQPRSQEETRAALQSLKEIFSMADIDGATSKIRVEQFTPFEQHEDIEGTLSFHGDKKVEYQFKAFQKYLVERSISHLRSSKKGSTQYNKAVSMINRIKQGEVYEVLDECFLQAEKLRLRSFPAIGMLKQNVKPFAESIILRGLATTFSAYVDKEKHTDKGTVWKRDDLQKAYEDFKKKELPVNIMIPDEENIREIAQEVIPGLIEAKNSFREPLRSKAEGIYMNLAGNLNEISNLYGDDARLDEKLNDVIFKLINDAENEFMYEIIVKDHARADRLAELYGMDSEMDKMFSPDSVYFNSENEKGLPFREFSIFKDKKYLLRTLNGEKEIELSDDEREQKGSRYPSYKYDSTGSAFLGNVKRVLEATIYINMPTIKTLDNKEFLKPNSLGIYESVTIYDRKATRHDPSEYYFFTLHDMEENSKNFFQIRDYSEGSLLKRAFMFIPKAHQCEVMDTGLHTLVPKESEIILKSARNDALEIAEKGNKKEAERRYSTFMQEARHVVELPYTGIKSELQKNAILNKLYNDIVVEGVSKHNSTPILEFPNYSENAQQEAEKFAKEALEEIRSSQVKKQITDTNLQAIDDMF